ncbi:MAG TPA: circularly permuted type 2 ATP-grasp protein, partial [Steroidobacteraceae bacterium]|nr:circularly permuted type 2 ATP-grasp protein [Steroidobacteraceae bacterium]
MLNPKFAHSSAVDTAAAKPYDEMLDANHAPRPHCRPYQAWLAAQPPEVLTAKRAEADAIFHRVGITFAVYGEGGDTERLIPFDIIPRIIPQDEWRTLEAGLKQRVRTLNAFIHDVYHDQNILKAGVVPAEHILCNAQYRPEMQGIDVPGGIYAHIAGVDVVRSHDGSYRVLEDNLRVPSGVSYMLENRQLTKQVFADLFRDLDIHPVDGYPNKLASFLGDLSPRAGAAPVIAVLTPGIFNSAYFEHAFLAQQMGAHLVEGHDLVVESDDCVYMRTIGGLVRVDVIYRRVDDVFLDPEVFRSDSMVGVHGLMRAWRAGKVAIANAPGTGVADDKVIYSYVPALVRYYLGEDPMIPIVPTWLCHDDKERSHVLSHLEEMVVKPANGSGGNGVFVGSMSTKAARDEMRLRVEANPRSYIAQPIVRLSTAPTLSSGRIVP